MNIEILCQDQKLELIDRLLKSRKISEDKEDFLNPTYKKLWIDPFLLDGMDKGIEIISEAIKNNEKIMIFGDYDVDGVTSSNMLYQYLKKFLGYNNISVMFPDRLEDGYGLKSYHLDIIKSKGVDLVITVDNGITSVKEAKHAKELGLKLLITDHHQPLDELPPADCIINPQCSANYPFKGLCGAGVVLKLIHGILSKSKFDQQEKQDIFQYFMPYAAIATVADCVPLTNENRLIVKQGLNMINSRHKNTPPPIIGMVEFLKIKEDVDSFHIGFLIGPRINAGGRIMSPYESFYSLLYSGEKQLESLQILEGINNKRKKLQDKAAENAKTQLSHNHNLLVAHSEDFHEGIIGIVAGRFAEKHKKPTIVLSINKERNHATGSLRSPVGFSISNMLQTFPDAFLRFGGHHQAGGATIHLDKLDETLELLTNYCNTNFDPNSLPNTIIVDTILNENELSNETVNIISNLQPFGVDNKEPIFFIENLFLEKVEKVGSRGNGHLKFFVNANGKKISTMMRGQGDKINKLRGYVGEINVIGKVKRDSYSGNVMIEAEIIFDNKKSPLVSTNDDSL